MTDTYRSWVYLRNRLKIKTELKESSSKRWEVFENFLKDMGEKPPGCRLARIDKAFGFYKENCRWVKNDKKKISSRNAPRTPSRDKKTGTVH